MGAAIKAAITPLIREEARRYELTDADVNAEEIAHTAATTARYWVDIGIEDARRARDAKRSGSARTPERVRVSEPLGPEPFDGYWGRGVADSIAGFEREIGALGSQLETAARIDRLTTVTGDNHSAIALEMQLSGTPIATAMRLVDAGIMTKAEADQLLARIADTVFLTCGAEE